MTNITIATLPRGQWQLWDGPEGKDGKSPARDYSQPILWERKGQPTYYAETAYFGVERVIKFERRTAWPFEVLDLPVA